MKKLDRKDILNAVVNNIPGDRMVGIPFMMVSIPKTNGTECENTRLIEDLGLDSLDISSAIYGACDELGVESWKVEIPHEDYGMFDTLGDIVNVIEKAAK